MEPPPTVVAVCGSLRDDSYTYTALEYALDAARTAGAETEHVDLREYDLPVYDPDEDAQGDSELLKRKVREADAVLFGSPNYHSSYSSAIKNLHDHCSYDEFEDTTVGLLVVAGGSTIASPLDHLRITVRGVNAWVLPHQVGIRNVYGQFEDREDPDAGPTDRAFVDPDLEERVRTLGRQAVEYARITPRDYSKTASTGD